MSDIDEIALETVKAIGNIDPDKLPGGRTQAIAQAQILVRDAIEKQLEQAQARVAELSEALQVAVDTPELRGGTWYDMAVSALAEQAGGEK